MLLILIFISLIQAAELKLSKTEIKTGELVSFEILSKELRGEINPKSIRIESSCLYFIVNKVEQRELITKVLGDLAAFDVCPNDESIKLMSGDQVIKLAFGTLSINKDGIDDKKLDQFIVIDSNYVDEKWYYGIILVLVIILIAVYLYYLKRKNKKSLPSLNERMLKKINSAQTLSELKDLYNLFQYINDGNVAKIKAKNQIAEKLFSPDLNMSEIEQIKEYFRKLIHD